MRITEAQLRRVVRKLVRENLDVRNLEDIVFGLSMKLNGKMVPGDWSSFSTPTGHIVSLVPDTSAPGMANIEIADMRSGELVTRPRRMSTQGFDIEADIDAAARLISKIISSLVSTY